MAPKKKPLLERQIAEHAVEYRENYYRLAYSYVRNAEDALDIVQESVCKALSSGVSLENPDNLKTWFYRIVVNTSLDFLRKQKKTDPADEEILASSEFSVTDNYEDYT